MEVDYCVNGHDITDKELMVRKQVVKGELKGYACRACLGVAQLRWRMENGLVKKPRTKNTFATTPIAVTADLNAELEQAIKKNLIAKIEKSNLTELLEIAKVAVALLPDTE
jgi:hypothetical protein